MSYNGQNTFCSLKAFYVHLLDIQVSSYISLKNHFFFFYLTYSYYYLILFMNPYTISTIIQFYLRYFQLNKLYLAYFQLYMQYLKKIYYAAITIFNVDQNKKKKNGDQFTSKPITNRLCCLRRIKYVGGGYSYSILFFYYYFFNTDFPEVDGLKSIIFLSTLNNDWLKRSGGTRGSDITYAWLPTFSSCLHK